MLPSVPIELSRLDEGCGIEKHFFGIRHALQDGRDILIWFNNQLGGALKNAYQINYDDEAVHLARAAQIVRRDILKITSKFSGSFDNACQYDSVPESLMTMILQDPSMKAVNSAKQQAALSLFQLNGFSCVESTKVSDCR